MAVSAEIKRAVAELGFTDMTPVQREVIPHILSGEDCLAEAPTGTGKTFAFGIPTVEMIDRRNDNVQTVILCPTRELAMQTEKELKKLSKYTESLRILAIYGGQPIQRQLALLRKHPQIIVGTPGRVLDHLRRKTLRLGSVNTVILDEADEMLDMGFREDIDSVLTEIDGGVSVQLFSATIPKEISEISKQYQNNPVHITTTCQKSELPQIKQYVLNVTDGNKFNTLKQIIDIEDYRYVLIFCNTKRRVDNLNKQLHENNYLSEAIHGDMLQRIRDRVMNSYRDRSINILVATDVAARGIDVADIEAVFNYDIPNDENYYVHRIGRTARASKTGAAYCFATKADKYKVPLLERISGSKMEEIIVDEENKELRPVPIQKTKKRFFINIGVKDAADKKKIIDFFVKNSGLVPSDFGEIKMLDIYSFVEINEDAAKETDKLIGLKFFGRKLAIELSTERTGGARGFGGKSYGRGKDRTASKDEKEYKQKSDERAAKKRNYTTETTGVDTEKPNKRTYKRDETEGAKPKAEREYKRSYKSADGESAKPKAEREYKHSYKSVDGESTKPKAEREYKRSYKSADGETAKPKAEREYKRSYKSVDGENAKPKERRKVAQLDPKEYYPKRKNTKQ